MASTSSITACKGLGRSHNARQLQVRKCGVCFYCETQICMSRTCNGIVSGAAGLLAGWVSVTAGIVSERLNLSANLLDHLVAQTFKYFVTPCADTKLQGEPLQWCYIYVQVGRKFRRLSTEMAVYIGYGARQDDSHYGTLIRSRGCRIDWYNFPLPSVTRNRNMPV